MQYQANAAYVAELGKPVVDLLAPRPGERILDLGCGDGALTLEIARRGCSVIGVDASEEMVRVARSLGVEARVVDGATLEFGGEFDAVFSNAMLHWIKPPEAVISGVWRALKPGGRFVGEFGGSGNVERIIRELEATLAERGHTIESPWYFPTPEEYSTLLENAGFVVHAIELFPRRTELPEDLGGWLETFAGHYISTVPGPERGDLIAEIVERLRDSLSDGAGTWFADYIRLRFSAEKPRSAA